MGKLPWQGFNYKSKEERNQQIKELKLNTSLEELTKGFPREFLIYMQYCRDLGFTQDPDYSYLRRIFFFLYVRLEYKNDFIFDWTIQKSQSQMNNDTFSA